MRRIIKMLLLLGAIEINSQSRVFDESCNMQGRTEQKADGRIWACIDNEWVPWGDAAADLNSNIRNREGNRTFLDRDSGNFRLENRNIYQRTNYNLFYRNYFFESSIREKYKDIKNGTVFFDDEYKMFIWVKNNTPGYIYPVTFRFRKEAVVEALESYGRGCDIYRKGIKKIAWGLNDSHAKGMLERDFYNISISECEIIGGYTLQNEKFDETGIWYITWPDRLVNPNRNWRILDEDISR